MQCPSCNAPLSTSDRFCQNCGAAVTMKAPVEAQTMQPPASAGMSTGKGLVICLCLILAVAGVVWWNAIHDSPKIETSAPGTASAPGVVVGTFSEVPVIPDTDKPSALPATTITTEPTTRVSFDAIKAGSITGDEFIAQGLRIVGTKGRIFATPATSPPMVMPDAHQQLLMVDGGYVTEMAFEFALPVRGFTITLPGVSGGTSFPTYRMTAFNAAGQGFDVIEAEHWIPAQALPLRLTLNSGLMTRVVIAVDNRFGDTAWATYNCVPIAEIELVR